MGITTHLLLVELQQRFRFQFRIDGAALTGASVTNGSGTFSTPTADLTLANVSAGTLPGDIRIAEYHYRPDNTPTTSWLDLESDTFNNPGSIAQAAALAVV